MAEDGLSFVTELKDQMSGPAHTEKAALEGLAGAINKVGEAEKKEHASAGLLGHAWEKARDVGHEFTSSLIPQIAMAELAAEAVKKLGEALIEGAKFAIEAAEFKENMVDAYTAVMGTAEEGEQAFAQIDKLADSIHMPAEQAHDIASTLMLEGLTNVNAVGSALTAIGDLQRVGMEKGAARLKMTIERSMSSGHFELGKKSLVGTGVSIDQLTAELATRLGKSRETIRAQLKAGQIDAETGIAALSEAIAHGKVGEIAANKFDLKDAATDMGNAVRKMFQDVDMGPLKQALVDLVSLFSSNAEKGQTMHDVITAVFNGIIRWVARGIEIFTILALKVEIFGLQAYIKLYPVINAFRQIEGAIEKVVDAMMNLGNTGDSIGERIGSALSPIAKMVTGALGGGVATPENAGPADVSAPVVKREPAHSMGGIVHEPPPGEYFAAVKPGEVIVPEGFRGAGPEVGPDRFQVNIPPLQPANSNGPAGPNVSVDVGGIHVSGKMSHEDMHILESHIADVFERAALELGA
jgi:hypothetical protein